MNTPTWSYRSVLACCVLALSSAGCGDRPQPPASTAGAPVAYPAAPAGTQGGVTADPSLPKNTPTASVNPAETADHAKAGAGGAQGSMTKKEEQSAMPTPGQANDHSTTAKDSKK